MTRFLLIRHGETDMVGTRLSGRMEGVHLNATGRAQAEQLPSRLEQVEIGAVYASPLERAAETAAPLGRAKGLEVHVSEALAELDYGEWTGRSFQDLESDAKWRLFNSYRSGARVPGGESMLEVQARMVRALETITAAHPDQRVAIVSHGDPTKSVLLYLLGMPLDAHARIDIDTGSVSAATVGGWGVKVHFLNDTAHFRTEPVVT